MRIPEVENLPMRREEMVRSRWINFTTFSAGCPAPDLVTRSQVRSLPRAGGHHLYKIAARYRSGQIVLAADQFGGPQDAVDHSGPPINTINPVTETVLNRTDMKCMIAGYFE